MLGKQEYSCHQGKYFSENKKKNYIEQRNRPKKSDIFAKSRKHTKPTKKKRSSDLHYTRSFQTQSIITQKSKLLGNNIWKHAKINKNIIRSLQYLVIFPNEMKYKLYYHCEAAKTIQTVDERVTKPPTSTPWKIKK